MCTKYNSTGFDPMLSEDEEEFAYQHAKNYALSHGIGEYLAAEYAEFFLLENEARGNDFASLAAHTDPSMFPAWESSLP